jgi:hypothetical protein
MEEAEAARGERDGGTSDESGIGGEDMLGDGSVDSATAGGALGGGELGDVDVSVEEGGVGSVADGGAGSGWSDNMMGY